MKKEHIVYIALSLAVGAVGARAVVSKGQSTPFPQDLQATTLTAGETMASSENYTLGFVAFEGGKNVWLKAWERESPSGDWVDQSQDVTTTFRITDIGFSNYGEKVFVAGIDDVGADVVEQWVLGEPGGGWILSGLARSSVGQSLGPPTPSAQISGSGGYVPPGSRGRPRFAIDRTVLFRGVDFGGIRSLVADPEGAFLLILAYETSDLVQMDLTTPAASPRSCSAPARNPHSPV